MPNRRPKEEELELFRKATSLLEYNEATGIFTWLVDRKTGGNIGDVAGTKDRQGYIVLRITGKIVQSHRLAYFMIHNKIPEGVADHINRVKSDNRGINLRLATLSENRMNAKTNKNNKSTGIKNVLKEPNGRYRVRIHKQGMKPYNKSFILLEEAIEHKEYMLEKLHGDYRNST